MDKPLWNFKTVGVYEALKFSTLLHEHNVISSSVIRYEFADDNVNSDGITSVSGWLLKKDKILYLLDKDDINKLPIRINEKQIQEIILKNNKHVQILHEPISFKITPNKIFTFRTLIDSMCPFKHSQPDNYTLYKIIMVGAWLDRYYVRLCTESEFGKDSFSTPMQSLLQDYRVVSEPRTVPAILREITRDGVIVFNEACGNLKKDVKDVMEGFMLNVAADDPIYKNGAKASAAHGTKDVYDISGESVVAIYNNLQQYKEVKKYFDYQFNNNDAIQSRLLPLKANGVLLEDFSIELDFADLAEKNQTYYANVLKSLSWYKQNHFAEYSQNTHFKPISTDFLSNRHKNTFNKIMAKIALYCENQEEYDKFVNLLITWNKDYYRMLNNEPELAGFLKLGVNNSKPDLNTSFPATGDSLQQSMPSFEEIIIDDDPTSLKFIDVLFNELIKRTDDMQTLVVKFGDDYIQSKLNKREIFEYKPGRVKLLE